jgi:hypothetical protein
MAIRTIPLVLTAAAAMALATPAAAKEIESAAVCGAGGCKAVSTKGDAHAMLEGGAVTDAPTPAAFYRIRLGIGDGSGKVFERFTLVYVPSADKVRGMDGQWWNTTTAADRALDRLVKGHEALPAGRLKLTLAEQTAQNRGTSLPPEVVTAPVEPPTSPDGGATSIWIVVLIAGGGLALAGIGGAWLLRRRPAGGEEAAVAP